MKFKLLLTTIISICLFATAPFAQANSTVGNLLNDINPAEKFDNSDTLIGDLLSAALPYTIVFAGMILTLFIVMGGYQLLTSPTNPQGQEAGKNKITWAIVGFLVIFSAFWIMQILQVIFGFNILDRTIRQGSSGPVYENNISPDDFHSDVPPPTPPPASTAANYVNSTPPAGSQNCQAVSNCTCPLSKVCYNNPNPADQQHKFYCCDPSAGFPPVGYNLLEPSATFWQKTDEPMTCRCINGGNCNYATKIPPNEDGYALCCNGQVRWKKELGLACFN